MSHFLIRGRMVIAVIVTVLIWFRFTDRNRKDSNCGSDRWLPVFDPTYLVTVVPIIFTAALILNGAERFRTVSNALAETMLTTAVYFAILLPVLPLLRRAFSARACAMLWLLPNVLYFVLWDSMGRSKPFVVLPVRAKLDWLLWVWLAGAVVVMAWKVAEHIRFRRALLRDAREPDAETLALFQSVREEMETEAMRKDPLPLLISPHTDTPLSVGLTRKSLRVVLPERRYTPDELRLIFRHELIHIARQDAGTKLFMACCTALMWWNPLMWLAMRRCADDLELGCDEFVLLDEPEAERGRYANLLLKTAGDERGFTTCLSATAEALRYRLENVLHPKNKMLGGMMLGIVALALVVFSGSLAIAYAPQRLDEAACISTNEGEWYYNPRDELTSAPRPDGTALWEALRSREVYQLSGNYRPDADSWLHGHMNEQWVDMACAGRYVYVEVYRFDAEKERSRQVLQRCFAFAEEPDWDALLG